MRHIGAGQTDYVWDVNRSLPEILQETVGSNTTSYVYGLGRISATDGAGNQTYFTSDGLGSTTDVTNGANPPQRTDGYTYDVFGAATHSPGGSTQPFQFTGQQTDADSGLQYLRARYYDPSAGRFLGRDPSGGAETSVYTKPIRVRSEQSNAALRCLRAQPQQRRRHPNYCSYHIARR